MSSSTPPPAPPTTQLNSDHIDSADESPLTLSVKFFGLGLFDISLLLSLHLYTHPLLLCSPMRLSHPPSRLSPPPGTSRHDVLAAAGSAGDAGGSASTSTASASALATAMSTPAKRKDDERVPKRGYRACVSRVQHAQHVQHGKMLTANTGPLPDAQGKVRSRGRECALRAAVHAMQARAAQLCFPPECASSWVDAMRCGCHRHALALA